MYGFMVTDGHGWYKRWFSSNGTYQFPMSSNMKHVADIIHSYDDFKEAAERARGLAINFDFEYTELDEQDYKNNNRLFKRKRK